MEKQGSERSGNSTKSAVAQLLGGGRIPTDKPLSIKLMQAAKAVFPEGKVFSHALTECSACSLLRVDGQRPCPLPREGDHSLFFLVHGYHPASQYLPSPQGEMWAKASLGARGRMLHGKIIFAPAETKPPKVYWVSRHQEQSLLIVSCPRAQRTRRVSFKPL